MGSFPNQFRKPHLSPYVHQDSLVSDYHKTHGNISVEKEVLHYRPFSVASSGLTSSHYQNHIKLSKLPCICHRVYMPHSLTPL